MTCIHIHDSKFDPTGTKRIRASFKREFKKRWDTVARLTTEAISTHDIIGINGHSMQSVALGYDKIQGFQTWIDRTLSTVFGNGMWMQSYLLLAEKKAEKVLGRSVNGNIPGSWAHIAALMSSELKGITSAVSQQCVRAVADGLLAHWRPAKIARACTERIRAIGRARGNGLADYMIVKAYNEAMLDVLENAGVSHVGVIPEYVRQRPPAARLTTDAVKPPRLFSKRRSRAQFQEVDVLTAGDVKVCKICQGIADNGPYEIAEARGLIPAHINCRCGFTPSGDLPLFDPSQVPERNRPNV